MLELNSKNFNILRKRIINISLEAAEVVMQNIGSKKAIKNDGTPVTLADIKSDHIITKNLNLLSPKIPVFSEEGKNFTAEENLKPHWLIDPLDGTKSFVEGGDDFVVCIAFIKKQIPLLGCIAHPPSKKVWIGGKEFGSYLKFPGMKIRKILCRNIPDEGPSIAISRHHIGPKLEAWLKKIKFQKTFKKGSALKFALLAEGKVDLYPRTSATYEWDSAAGQAIVEGSGGKVHQLNGNKLIYGRPNRMNPNFIAYGNSNWVKFLVE